MQRATHVNLMSEMGVEGPVSISLEIHSPNPRQSISQLILAKKALLCTSPPISAFHAHLAKTLPLSTPVLKQLSLAAGKEHTSGPTSFALNPRLCMPGAFHTSQDPPASYLLPPCQLSSHSLSYLFPFSSW